MCHTLAVTHICSHTVYHTLSTCRATVPKRIHIKPKPVYNTFTPQIPSNASLHDDLEWVLPSSSNSHNPEIFGPGNSEPNKPASVGAQQPSARGATTHHPEATRPSEESAPHQPLQRTRLVAACARTPLLTLLSPSTCGPCLHAACTAAWARRIGALHRELQALRASFIDPAEPWGQLVLSAAQEQALRIAKERWEQAQEEEERCSWGARRCYPPMGKVVRTRADLKVGARVRGGSLLRCEVRGEDVVEGVTW